MRKEQLGKIKQDLQQIADMLLLNGTLTECPGLVNGKMGILVFFFHYARYTGNELYADYAMDLVGEMLNQIHVNSPADYEKGLAGIGVGIDYLIRNDFLNAEDDICEDFDQRMVRAVLYDPWSDFSQYDGMTGYGRYWISRLRYQVSALTARQSLLRIITLIEQKLPDIPANEQTDVYCFLHDLCQIQDFEMCKVVLKRFNLKTVTSFSRLGGSTFGNIVRMVQQCRYFNFKRKDEIYDALTQIPDLDMGKTPESMGLLAGYASEGMLRMTALNQTDMSWMNLL